MKTETYKQLIELANAHIEGRLAESERQALETILQTDPEARRMFADFMHDHAALHWDGVSETTAEVGDFSVTTSAGKSRGWMWAVAAMAMISVTVAAVLISNRGEASSFATMEETKAARWESGDLPTADGARLGQGNLRLAEGLATLRFDSGAEIVLEAPAEVKLVDAMNCVLVHGTAVAEVPESALGFRIETPSANVVDYGTRFAVNVDPGSGATQTQVFDGLVEVEHPKSGKVVELKAGERNFAAGDQVGQATAGPEEGEWSHAVQPIRRGPDWTILPSARDAYVHSREIKDHTSDVLLLVKNGRLPDAPSRKAYLGFDLSSIDPARIADAELILHFAPTGWGLASVVPDAEFSVYGLVQSGLDDWSEEALAWDSAPANATDDGAALEAGQAQKLGSFVIEQGVQRGSFGIRGEELADFLRSGGADGFATLVVVRETLEEDDGGLVHGFASRRHPILPAPALAVRVGD